jgi:hypothetical protein
VKIDRETVVTISFEAPTGGPVVLIGLVDEPITLDVADNHAAQRIPNIWVLQVLDKDEPAVPRRPRRKPKRQGAR